MKDLKRMIPTEIIRLEQRKDQGRASFRDFTKLIRSTEEGLYVHGLLARTRLEHIQETISPVHEKLGEIVILGDKPSWEISEIREDLGNLITTVGGWTKEELPHRSEGLVFYAHFVTQFHLPKPPPTLAEAPGLGEYDELVTECNQLNAANSNLARRLDDAVRARDEAVRAQDVVQAALTARTDGRLRMTESYEGVVRHVGRDDVVVLFEVDDDLVEHTYTRNQFVDSRLPEKGDRLAVYVHVAQLPPEESAEGADETTEGIDERPRRRRNIGPPPREV